MQFCPLNSFVIGYRLYLDPYEGPRLSAKDDVAVAGIQLICGRNATIIGRIASEIYAKETNHEGYWTEDKYCSGFATGYQVKYLTKKTLLTVNDALGITSVILFCDGGSRIELGHGFLSDTEKDEPIRCRVGEAIAGLRTEGMYWRRPKKNFFSSIDNLGLTSVAMDCLRLDEMKIVESCVPEERWMSFFKVT